ncbi:hypothetical protein BJ742DRAFT_796597 [Cladochytrium replicatum]|nr:hypothetical protein BJ742DRAFT_796597 [Cladochytrium replicatum]
MGQATGIRRERTPAMDEKKAKEDGEDIEAVGDEKNAIPLTVPVEETQASTASLGWGSFSWGKLVETVKKQSDAVVEVYKRDLTEFVTVVAAESTSTVDKLAHTVTNIKLPVAPSSRVSEADERTSDSSNASAETTRTRADSEAKTISIDAEGQAKHAESGFDQLVKMADAAENLLERFSTGLTGFLSNAVVVTPAPDRSTKSRKRMIFDRKSAQLSALRLDPATYLKDPAEILTVPPPPFQSPADTAAEREVAEKYVAFKEKFHLADHASQIAKILSEEPEVAKLMDRIVPAQVARVDFWARYYFQVQELDREDKQRKELIQGVVEQEDFSWDSDDQDETTTEGSPERTIPETVIPATPAATVSKGDVRPKTSDSPVALESHALTGSATYPPKKDGIEFDTDTENSYEIVDSEGKKERTSLESEKKEESEGWDEWE